MPAENKGAYHEPWVQNRSKGLNQAGGVVFEALGKKHAARIVATMNACEGFERPEVLREIVEYARDRASRGPGGYWQALLDKLDKPADADGGA